MVELDGRGEGIVRGSAERTEPDVTRSRSGGVSPDGAEARADLDLPLALGLHWAAGADRDTMHILEDGQDRLRRALEAAGLVGSWEWDIGADLVRALATPGATPPVSISAAIAPEPAAEDDSPYRD